MTDFIRKAIYTTEDETALIAKGEEWNFHAEETKEHLHSLHPYPAKFIPQIPRRAIELWSEPGDLIYDPFNGCGTTVLEASLAGRRAIGTDNNAVAILAAKAKTALYSQADLESLGRFSQDISGGLDFAASRPDLIPANKNFHYWFDPLTVERLAALKGLILEEIEPVRSLLMAIFSSIVVRVSYQDSDTRYSRKEREVSVKDVDDAFRTRLADTLRRLQDIPLEGRGEVDIRKTDARSVPFILDDSVTLIATSPPYLNAYDYHKYHRQRLHWIGGDNSVVFARDLEIGSHDRFTRKDATPDRYFEDMDACFAEWSRVLKKGGHCLIVVGDAIVSKKPVYVGDKFITLLLQRGFTVRDRWIRTLHATKRAFNVKNSRISHEHVLWVQKQ
jgi:DNA modification methylase